MALFNLLLFTLLLSLIIFLFFYFNHVHTIKKNKKLQLRGLARLKNLRLLLTAMQQHRGLTMAYLNGDIILLQRIKPLEKSINDKIAEINLEKEWLAGNAGWVGVSDHWQRLLNNYRKYDHEYNYRQHCNLIKNILNLIEECAGQHHLQELFRNNQQNANFLWSQLLFTTEHIGQARAIGTSIAAAKSSSSVQRIQLNYLQECIQAFLVGQAHHLDITLIDKFLNTINQEILVTPPTISAEAFFNLATSVIEALLAESDNYLNDLQKSLSDN